MFIITQKKYKCPVNNCDKEPTGMHRFITHFRGAHIKGQDASGMKEALEALDKFEVENSEKELLQKEFGEYGPEGDDGDEEKVDAKKCSGMDKEFIINQYLSHAICREERQYALFLANGLKKNNSALKDKLKLNTCEVLEVFYEATLMRDFWCLNRSLFNERLFDFVMGKKPWDCEISDKKNDKKGNHANYWAKKHPLACWMMNAKPDLAVLHNRSDGKCPTLSFIECKYLSDVDTYYYRNENGFEYTQVELQKLILEFLCDELKLKYSLENNNERIKVNLGEVKVARFNNEVSLHGKGKGNNTNEYEIPIKLLREIGY